MARNAKFWLLYKRPGQRVLINDRGDMLVRPSYAELSMQQSPFMTSLAQARRPLAARICILGSSWIAVRSRCFNASFAATNGANCMSWLPCSCCWQSTGAAMEMEEIRS